MSISKYIEHTLLKSTATEREIINLCQEAIDKNFYSVCVNSCYVALAKQLLEGTEVKICAVIGFPLGGMSTEAKVDGADEIDMVMNVGFLKSKNYVLVFKDIRDVKMAIGRTPLKVIIEISELNKNEVIKICEICMDAKAEFIKTSTGYSKGGATLTAVKIIKKTVKDNVKIKASGGIRDYDTAIKYIEAGADRIGTSSGINIVNMTLSPSTLN
jgi:deoxyribose-phosphate aldolase